MGTCKTNGPEEYCRMLNDFPNNATGVNTNVIIDKFVKYFREMINDDDYVEDFDTSEIDLTNNKWYRENN